MNHRALLLNTLREDASFIINKRLVHALGINAALLLADLVSKESFYLKQYPTKDAWFWNTTQRREKDTGLSPYQQRRELGVLKGLGLVETKLAGVPARTHFRLNHQALTQLLATEGKEATAQLLRNLTSSCEETKHLYNNIIKSSKEDYRGFPGKEGKPEGQRRRTAKTLLTRWNSLPNVRKHNRPYTNIYESALRRLEQLLAGQLYKLPFSSAWLERVGVNKRTLRRKWTEEGVAQNLERLALLFSEGYWPKDKSHITKDLPGLIYNLKTQHSWFLVVDAHPPRSLAETIERRRGGSDDTTTRKGIQVLKQAVASARLVPIKPDEADAIRDVVKFLQSEYLRLSGKGSLFNYLIPTMLELYTSYAKWIEDKYGGSARLEVRWLRDRVWGEFLKQFEEG